MLNPESDVAERLAEALRHHQKNLVERKKAHDDVQRLEQMLDLLQQKQAEDRATAQRDVG